MLRLILLLLGLAALLGLAWHVGPSRLWGTISSLGPWSLLLILIPSTCVYLLEAVAWRLTIGSGASNVALGRLWAIRMTGEMVNMTTPTAYLGGEPLKAFLLTRAGVPFVDGLASVVLAKTLQTIAEAAFILLGLALGLWLLGASGASGVSLVAGLVTAGLLLAGAAVFVAVQYRGLFGGLLALLRWCRVKIAFLESREARLHELDRTIRNFYAGHPRRFLLCVGLFFLA